MATRISTYKVLIEELQSIALSHIAVKQFQVGQLSDLDVQNDEYPFQRFPVVFLIPEQSEMDRYGKVKFSFRLIVADIAENKEDLQINVHNTTFMIIQDLMSKIIMTTWGQLEIEAETPVIITPFVEKFNSNLAGWSVDLDLIVKSSFDLCSAAFNN